MSQPPSPSAASPGLKRRRTAEPESALRPHPTNNDSQHVGGGVYVQVPQPSSSAMAAYHASHLPSFQLGDSQISLPASLFGSSQPAPPNPVQSGSEYLPSTQQDTSNSTGASMPPLPAISASVFEPFLDDTTRLHLEFAEDRIAQKERQRRRRARGNDDRLREGESSSPVESFSPREVVEVRPEEVPRIGTWVLPPLTAENSNPYAEGYVSGEVLSQIPAPAFDHDQGGVWEPALTSAPPLAPLQQEPELEPIPSQPEPPSSTPALPPPPLSAAQQTQPSKSASASTTSSGAGLVGWSTLPRPELVSLMHASPHIPSFLKDEIDRFILRAHRASSCRSQSQSQSQRSSRSHRRRSNSQSQSLSQPQNDDSETQEDGFLRTKQTWVMDLLLLPTPSSTLESLGELGERVGKLTQQSQSQGRGGVAVILLLDTVGGTFDVHELEESLAGLLRADRRYSVLFDCDGRKWNSSSSSFSSSQLHNTPTPAVVGGVGDLESANAQIILLESKLEAANKELESLTTNNKTLQKKRSEAEAQHDFIRTLYDRASASSTSAQASAAAAEARIVQLEAQLSQGLALHSAALQDAIERWKMKMIRIEREREFERNQKEITEGEQVRRKAALWDQFQAEERDRERTQEDRVRVNNEKRRKLAPQLWVEGMVVEQGGMGPFARPEVGVGVGGAQEVDEMDELAALAREAEEAGDILPTPSSPSAGGRSRRSRRPPPSSTNQGERGEGRSLNSFSSSNRPPPSASQVAAQVEAANLSSSNALEDSRLELEDQFLELEGNIPFLTKPRSRQGGLCQLRSQHALFLSSLGTPQAEGVQEAGSGIELGDFNAAPSTVFADHTGAEQGDLFAQRQDGQAGWGEGMIVESGDLPAPVGSQSLLLSASSSDFTATAPARSAEGGQESSESQLQPHTQP
ncbi:uncharacterized protein UDID_04855 [Ustilago sp. UG-2017a]|nr:uncharacterized protein UDID_04855 [Ustilago sp. UG-2017a]